MSNPSAPDVPAHPQRHRPWRAAAVTATIAATVGTASYLSELDEISAAATRHRITAVIVEPVTFTENGLEGALVRWDAPDGTRRTARLLAPPGLTAGAWYEIWTDDNGELARAPTGYGPALGRSAALAAVAAMIAAAALSTARRRLPTTSAQAPEDSLDIEWRRVAEQWRRRHG